MITGPFEPRVLVVERRIETGVGGMVVTIAQDAQDMAQARRAFGGDLAIFLGLLWAVLTAAAWIQVNLGLKPLKSVRSDVDELRRNPLARIPEGRLTELAPLVEALNALADARAQDLLRARRRAADMAHGLKTPIAALTAQVRRLPPAEPAAEGLRKSIAAIRATVEAELAQNRIAGARTEAGLSAAAAPVARQLAAVLAHTDRGDIIEISVELDETLAAPVDSADLTEILGAVLENAVRHARTRVRVRGAAGEAIRLFVEDDGEGVPEALRGALLKRGFSRDETGGSGLGLSIAQGLVEATHGIILLSESALGGLQVELSWPRP
jgi:signal transduction histidine kinase